MPRSQSTSIGPRRVTVRQAGLADLDLLVPMFDAYRQFYGRACNPDADRVFLRERFNHGESVLFIALEGADALGFTQLYPTFSSLSLARTLVLNDLFVLDEARGLGAGKALIAAAVEYGLAVGAISLALSTAKTNHRAQALYRQTGWVCDEAFDRYSLTLSEDSRFLPIQRT